MAERKDHMRTQNEGKFMMLEKDDVRYEFFTRPVMESNLSKKIAYYQPIVRYCRKLVSGDSTYTDDRVSVEEGNKFYKKLLLDGFKKVSERSFS